MYYYTDSKGNHVGPFDKDALKKMGITRATLVWREGWPTWIAAEKVPELADIFIEMPPVPPTPPAAPAAPAAAPQTKPVSPDGIVKPDSYMWLSILTTILCCLPPGIVAIIFSSKVDSCWNMGQYQEAVDNSKKALYWSIGAAAAGAFVGFLYIVGALSL